MQNRSLISVWILFDKGEYHKAVEQENLAKNIVEVLYPNDNHYAGKELRLKQQYFFISASIQEAIAKFKKNHDDLHDLPKKVTFQLNDTHPTMTVAELMRILLDEEGTDLGRSMGYHNTYLCIHQPYHHGRSSGKMADRAVLQTTSSCIPDHRRDQPQIYPGDPEQISGKSGKDPEDGYHL